MKKKSYKPSYTKLSLGALLLTSVFISSCAHTSDPSVVMPALTIKSAAKSKTKSAIDAVAHSFRGVAQDLISQVEAQEALKTDVALINANTGERTVVSIAFDGSVSDREQKNIEEFFRCRRSNKKHAIDQGLLAKLADLSRRFDGRAIDVVSGYRHAPYSTKTSRHRHGRAADIRIVGVDAKTLRDYLWLRHGGEVGVGYYKQQQFVHLDHRPGHKPTAWTQHREESSYKYNPRWARKLDREMRLSSIH